MKRTLLTLALGALACFIANADDSVVTFNGYNYTGDVTNVSNVAIVDFAMDKTINIPDAGSFKVTTDEGFTNTSVVKASDNPYLQFAKNNTLTITPASGVTITKVYFKTTTASYTWEVTASSGKVEYNKENKTTCAITWTGSESSPISFDNNVNKEPIRIMYFQVTYTKGASAIESVAADSNASVRYYNLNGNEVNAPVKGGVYVQVSGDEAHKIIAE